MLFRRRSDLKKMNARTSEIMERIQRLEAEHFALRAEIGGERHLRFLTAQIVGAAADASIIGSPVQKFAQAMRAPLPRGRAGGMARASSAGRYFDGTFMPPSEKREAYRLDYERFARGGRVRATLGLRGPDGRFVSNEQTRAQNND